MCFPCGLILAGCFWNAKIWFIFARSLHKKSINEISSLLARNFHFRSLSTHKGGKAVCILNLIFWGKCTTHNLNLISNVFITTEAIKDALWCRTLLYTGTMNGATGSSGGTRLPSYTASWTYERNPLSCARIHKANQNCGYDATYFYRHRNFGGIFCLNLQGLRDFRW